LNNPEDTSTPNQGAPTGAQQEVINLPDWFYEARNAVQEMMEDPFFTRKYTSIIRSLIMLVPESSRNNVAQVMTNHQVFATIAMMAFGQTGGRVKPRDVWNVVFGTDPPNEDDVEEAITTFLKFSNADPNNEENRRMVRDATREEKRALDDLLDRVDWDKVEAVG
jgi:hypothetical protein